MTAKQAGYEWLWDEPAPRMLKEALACYGTKEAPGAANNPTIIAWADECGIAYTADATAFCGLGMALSAKRAGWDFEPQGNALWARNWAKWGVERKGPAMLGDVLVFPRGKGGHVALYVGEDDTHYHIFGFNQRDSVNIVRKPKKPILAIRHAPWRVEQPPNVRRIFLSAKGAPVSGSEA